MIVNTLNDIRELRIELPEDIIEWFDVQVLGLPEPPNEYKAGVIYIKSALLHVDGETKSPFFYDEYTIGECCKENAIRKFNEFLKEAEFLIDVNNFNL